MMVVSDGKKIYLISGTGDVVDPERDAIGIGSGGNFALAAALATDTGAIFSAEEIARKSVGRRHVVYLYQRFNHHRGIVRYGKFHRSSWTSSPKQIVAELDKYIIGQEAAKRTTWWRFALYPPKEASWKRFAAKFHRRISS